MGVRSVVARRVRLWSAAKVIAPLRIGIHHVRLLDTEFGRWYAYRGNVLPRLLKWPGNCGLRRIWRYQEHPKCGDPQQQGEFALRERGSVTFFSHNGARENG